MPHSLRDNDAEVREYARKHKVYSLLDVGAGSGTYGRLLGDLVQTLDAVEVWRPYVKEYGLDKVYREVHIGDVRDLAYGDFKVGEPKYDLIIFGDILEHMTEDEARSVWEWAGKIAHHGMISVPIVHWPQGPVGGNPFEAHVQDHLHAEDVIEIFGPFDEVHKFKQTATFLKAF